MFKKTPHPQTCEKCPQRYAENGCPCWISLIETNPEGEVRNREGCFYPMMMECFIHVIKASNRPAAAMESLRNEIVTRQDILAEGLETALSIIGQGTEVSRIPLRPQALIEERADGQDKE